MPRFFKTTDGFGSNVFRSPMTAGFSGNRVGVWKALNDLQRLLKK